MRQDKRAQPKKSIAWSLHSTSIMINYNNDKPTLYMPNISNWLYLGLNFHWYIYPPSTCSYDDSSGGDEGFMESWVLGRPVRVTQGGLSPEGGGRRLPRLLPALLRRLQRPLLELLPGREQHPAGPRRLPGGAQGILRALQRVGGHSQVAGVWRDTRLRGQKIGFTLC